MTGYPRLVDALLLGHCVAPEPVRSALHPRHITESGVDTRDRPRLGTYDRPETLTYSGDSHLMTIAPTGAGKGRSAIIPNLLQFPGPVVIIDPKGENYHVTAGRRRALGHEVILLDPFRLI